MEEVSFDFPGRIPVFAETDVLIVGAGPGGLGAALMSARSGVKTMVVEASGAPGGMANLGEITPFMPSHSYHLDGKGNILSCDTLDKPVYPEWTARMHSYLPPCQKHFGDDSTLGDNASRIISKSYALLAAEDLLLEAGVNLLYHHRLVGVKAENRRISYAVFHSKSGFRAVRAKRFIDATGDGDMAALAGCSFEFGDTEHGLCQPMTLCFKLRSVDVSRIPPGSVVQELYDRAKREGIIHCPRENVLRFDYYDRDVVHFNTTRIVGKSGVSGKDLSDAEIEGRSQLREILFWLRNSVPGFENASIFSIAAQTGVRESRRISGLKRLTENDFLNRSKFPDAIARCSYCIDIHSVTGSGTRISNLPLGEWYEIPYGCIIPKDCDNLAMACRAISVDHAIHSSMRVMPPVISIGQGAGVAAALSLKTGTDLPFLDGTLVRKELIARGAALD